MTEKASRKFSLPAPGPESPRQPLKKTLTCLNEEYKGDLGG